jgi:anti-sigma factor RsiW
MPASANDPAGLRLNVSQVELADYVRGGLPRDRRRVVEGMLACNPDLAAQVMTQLHLQGGSPRRIRRRWGKLIATMAVGLAACLGLGAGWVAAEQGDLDGWRELSGAAPPEYVEEAAETRQASRLREAMASQVETPRLDAAEIRRTLNLTLPELPAEWRIRDVQVFPSDEGPAVVLVIEAPSRQRLELFVVRASTSATGRPVIAVRGAESVAFWERGQAAYVLSGPHSHAELMLKASNLAVRASL